MRSEVCQTKWDIAGWISYVVGIILTPLGLLLANLITNPNSPDQTYPSVWIGVNCLLRIFLLGRPLAMELRDGSIIIVIYIAVSLGWFVYGLFLISMQYAYQSNFYLWLLLTCTFVIDTFISGCLYPCLLFISRIPEPVVNGVTPQPTVARPNSTQRELTILTEQITDTLRMFSDLERQVNQEGKVDESKISVHGFYNTCPICKEHFKETDQVKEMPCKHIFHPGCLDPWFSQGRNTCPTCRQAL
jgi:hypothetical protein